MGTKVSFKKFFIRKLSEFGFGTFQTSPSKMYLKFTRVVSCVIVLSAICMLVFSACSQSPEKQRGNLLKSNPNAKVLSTPVKMTDELHYMIWENDGNIYYSELDGQDPKLILSKTENIITYKCNLILDENYKPYINLEKMDFDYLAAYNNGNIKYISGSWEDFGGTIEVYGYYIEDKKLALMEIGNNSYVLSSSKPNTLYCFDRILACDSDVTAILDYDLTSFKKFNDMLLKDQIWMKLANSEECDNGYSLTVWADITDNVDVIMPSTFKYGWNTYEFTSFKQPQFLTELFNTGRRYFFKDILIPEWVKQSNPYNGLAKMYETNIIEASSQIPIGDYYLVYGKFEKIRYADSPVWDGPNCKYKYVLHTNWYGPYDPMIIYTDDDNFAKMDYPQYLWVIGRFDSFKSYGNKTSYMDNGAVFRDVVLFAHSPEYSDYPQAVIPSFLPAGL